MFTYFLTDQRPCYLRALISFLCPQKSISHPYLKNTSPFQLHGIKLSMLQSWKDSLCPHSPSFTGFRSDVSLGSFMQPFLAAAMMVYLTGVTFFFFSCSMVSRLFATPWMVCSPPGSSVHGDSPARILECVAMPSSQIWLSGWNWELLLFIR